MQKPDVIPPTTESISAREAARRRSGFKARLRMTGGLALLVIGVICSIPGIPGPGLVMIGFALVILSDHFLWARTALEWVRRKIHRKNSTA